MVKIMGIFSKQTKKRLYLTLLENKPCACSTTGNREISTCKINWLQRQKITTGNLRAIPEIGLGANVKSSTYKGFFSLREMAASLWEMAILKNHYGNLHTLFCQNRPRISHSAENRSNYINKKYRGDHYKNICSYIFVFASRTSKKFLDRAGDFLKNADMGNENWFLCVIYNKFVGLMSFPIASKPFPVVRKNLCKMLKYLCIFSNFPQRPQISGSDFFGL